MTIHTNITPATAAAPPAELAEAHFKTALGILETTHSDAAQGWTPQRQAQFLAGVADGATVQDAAKEVGLSRRSAYAFRRTAKGAVFKLGWQAAEILAADSLREDLWDRARHGQTWTVVRDDGEKTITTTRHALDNRLALAMLTRLESKVVEAYDANEVLLAGKFDEFLTLLETGEAPADPVQLLDRVAPVTDEQFGIGTREPCESEDEDDDAADDEPPVFKRSWSKYWLTRFPPPDDFLGEEDGDYGDPDYSRELTEDEEEAILHFREDDAPDPALVARAAAERDAWFAAARGFACPSAVMVAAAAAD